MCGFLALIGSRPESHVLETGLDIMRHRGPDGSGVWSDGRAWLGHRRLSIIDLSADASQPMSNEDESVWLVFNGEIYNFRDLQVSLRARGHQFKSRSDSEVILHAYEEYGIECLSHLHGMFAFCLWDRKKGRLLVARDRFGKKPLYYSIRPGGIAVSSELPALVAAGLVDPAASRESLALYWKLGYLPAPYSVYATARKLPAGHAMVWESGIARCWRYYPPAAVEPFRGSYREALETLRTLLRDAVERRLVCDREVALALSGGIDSAVVAIMAREVWGGVLRTVTVRPHIDGNRHDEGAEARRSADLVGACHVEARSRPDLFAALSAVVKQLGEPFAVASCVPSYYLFQAVRQFAVVVLTGDGGDELFAGYDHYAYSLLRRRLRHAAPLWSMLRVVGDAAYAACPTLRASLKLLHSMLQVAADEPVSEVALESRRLIQPDVMREFMRTDVVSGMRASIAALFSERSAMKCEMLIDQFTTMSDHILTKVDSTSMHFGVEARSPLLDHRVAEFARALPDEFLWQPGRPKRMLRDLLGERWPRELAARPKSGFGLPLREILSEDGTKVRELLLSGHGLFDSIIRRAAIEGLLQAHQAGRPFHTQLLLKLMALRLWCEHSNAHF